MSIASGPSPPEKATNAVWVSQQHREDVEVGGAGYIVVCRLLISQDVGKMGFRQISLNIYILYQK